MSTTLNHHAHEWNTERTPNGWNFPPIYTVPEPPSTLTALDRKILLTLHAIGAFIIMAAVPLTTIDPNLRVGMDLAVIAYLVVPAIIMAGTSVPGRTWWTIAAPLVSALYLWLPSTAAGSVHADAHIVAIVGLATIAPLLNVIAPFILIAQSDARPWPLAGYGLAALGATGLVYASVAYPVVASVGS